MQTTINTSTALSNLIQGYRLYAKTEGKSPKTIGIYTTALTVFESFLKQDDLPTDVTQIGVQELRRFILYLQQAKAYRKHRFTKPQSNGLTWHTINCYLRAIRAFWSWLVSEEIIATNPFAKVRIPKAPRKVIPTFSDSQIRVLLSVIRTRTAIGFRDWVMILTLLDTGLRVSELVNLSLDDVNLDDGLVKVYGKGAKERMVPIGARVQRALAKYISRYRPGPVNEVLDYIFLTRVGESLTANRIEAIIENYGRKAAIEGVRCSPHTFRHTFAISYLRNGGDVFSLQRILGHESLDMVRNYLNIVYYDLQAVHQRCSPVDNLKVRTGGSYSCKLKASHIEPRAPTLVRGG